MIASFACIESNSKGRYYKENNVLDFLSSFEIDRNRIVESTAFRRLQNKTQVFVSNESDHYRNRLTHSLEAAQIARMISKALDVSQDLAELLTLAHDIGHAPFGHAGEEALIEVLKEYNLSFDHNSHSIKLVTELENRHPEFSGLNLTWESIEGIAKHNGPILNPTPVLIECDNKYNLMLDKYPSLEAQISSISDDIAYNNHDIDDAFSEGILSIDDLLSIDKLRAMILKIKNEYGPIEDYKIIHETINRMKKMMILDVIENTRRNIKKFSIETVEDIRNCKQALVKFSDEMELYHREIKNFLSRKVYKHYLLKRMTNKAIRIVKELFYLYMDDLRCLPDFLQTNISLIDSKEAAIVVSNFIACMSDRYAMNEYRSFFNLS